MDGDFVFAPDGAFVMQKPVVCVPFDEYEQIFDRIKILTEENKALRRQLVKLRRGGDEEVKSPSPPAQESEEESSEPAPPPETSNAKKPRTEVRENSDAPPPDTPRKSRPRRRSARRAAEKVALRETSPRDKSSKHQPERSPPPKSSKDKRERSPPKPSKDKRERSPPKSSKDKRERSPPKPSKDKRERSPPKSSKDKREQSPPKSSKDKRERSPPKPSKDKRERSRHRSSKDKRRRESSSRKRQKHEKRSSSRRASSDGSKSDSESRSDSENEEAPNFSFNAIQVANRMCEVYCEKIENNTPLEKRMPRIKKKLTSFLEVFSPDMEVLDAKSGKVVVAKGVLASRYECIFRESGGNLSMTVNKRFFFETESKDASYCIDFEHHESVVTATPGTRPDGSLGVLPPRALDVIVLYEVTTSRIQRMWCAQDKDGLGLTPEVDRAKLMAHPVVSVLLKKVDDLVGKQKVEQHFHNYLVDETTIR